MDEPAMITEPEAGAVPSELQLSASVPIDQLCWRCPPESLDFETTATLTPLEHFVGQDRGVHAIEFGIGLSAPGFNIYVAGPAGTGRGTVVRDKLRQEAAKRSTPLDLCYVHNFADPYRPQAIELPAGWAPQLRRDLERFVAGCQREIPRALESDEYQERRSAIMQRLESQREELLNRLRAAAEKVGFTTQLTPMGIVNVPLLSPGKPMSPEAFELLPDPKKAEIRAHGQQLQRLADDVLLEVHRAERDTREQFRVLERDVALFAVGHLLEELRTTYSKQARLVAHFDAIQADLLDHLDEFHPTDGEERRGDDVLHAPVRQRYGVNVLVSHGAGDGAPVVIEPNPTYYNLLGKVDYRAAVGAMSTDFSLIKPGALHRANGGFLVVQARDLLINPFAWDALKRALRDREIRVENLGEQVSSFPTTSLKPEPVPLVVKVVLLGDVSTYLMLLQLDEDFAKLFKVKAQFSTGMARTTEATRAYAEFICAQVREQSLLPFHREAVARIIEHGARLDEHQERLATRFNVIGDLVTESDYWARTAGHDVVLGVDVQRALEDQIWRANEVEEEMQRAIDEGSIAIDVTSATIGQVNGLSVLSGGDYVFGRPTRITARTAPGADGVVNIEREVRMSGPTYDKGVLILSGFLNGSYARTFPLALSAHLTFEQMYSGVDGDSASGAELCAMISSIAEVPIRQGIAMTGSVNQFGEIQAVGGVTYKIEGFYAVCKAQGLNGKQGVIIPRSNVRHLMLKQEIVDAVASGQFHVWSVASIDSALELLTGEPAGARLEDGNFPPDTIHGKAMRRLQEFSERVRELGDASRVR